MSISNTCLPTSRSFPKERARPVWRRIWANTLNKILNNHLCETLKAYTMDVAPNCDSTSRCLLGIKLCLWATFVHQTFSISRLSKNLQRFRVEFCIAARSGVRLARSSRLTSTGESACGLLSCHTDFVGPLNRKLRFRTDTWYDRVRLPGYWSTDSIAQTSAIVFL